MDITYDRAKDRSNLDKHGVSLCEASLIEWDTAIEKPDDRKDYGEQRYRPLDSSATGCIAWRMWIETKYGELSVCVRQTQERSMSMSKQTSKRGIVSGEVDADADQARARRLKIMDIIMPTAEEDAAITTAALLDPDNPPLAEGEMAHFLPLRKLRGRPVQSIIKVPTTMRLDSDIVDSFKATGDGWQTRVNEALRDYLAARNMLAHRYHATVHHRDNKTEQLGEFLVVATDDVQARQKVKHHLRERGDSETAHASVRTVDIGNVRMDDLDVIY